MPAAAVIPAPIAYSKVVAVKRLVVGSYVIGSDGPRRLSIVGPPGLGAAGRGHCLFRTTFGSSAACAFTGVRCGCPNFLPCNN